MSRFNFFLVAANAGALVYDMVKAATVPEFAFAYLVVALLPCLGISLLFGRRT